MTIRSFIFGMICFLASGMSVASGDPLFYCSRGAGFPAYQISTSSGSFVISKIAPKGGIIGQLVVPPKFVKTDGKSLQINFDGMRLGGYAKFDIRMDTSALIEIALSGELNRISGNSNVERLNTFGKMSDVRCFHVR